MRTVEHEVLVHLVGDDDRVVPVGEAHHLVEHLTGEHCARRIVRVIDEDYARAVGDGLRQPLEVGLEVGPTQRNRHELRPARATQAAYES